jgi:quercetin dioxygenase-like cupin family protein
MGSKGDAMKVAKSINVAKKPVNVEGAKGVGIRVLISKDDGAPTFAMRMFEIEPGGNTPLHRHPHEHEVFIVEGAGVFVHEGQNHPISMEDVIFVPGNDLHSFKNTSDSTLRFLCLVPLSGA